jgi:hypothetical protein
MSIHRTNRASKTQPTVGWFALSRDHYVASSLPRLISAVCSMVSYRIDTRALLVLSVIILYIRLVRINIFVLSKVVRRTPNYETRLTLSERRAFLSTWIASYRGIAAVGRMKFVPFGTLPATLIE